jgi:hypothetical protein
MSVVSFRPPLTSQPVAALEIDWDNPITRGLRFSTYHAMNDYAAGPRNYVTGVPGRTNRAVSFAMNAQRGSTPIFDGSASAAVALPNLAGVPFFTMSFWLWWNAYANGDGKFAFNFRPDNGTADAGSFTVFPNDSSGNFALIASSGPSNQAAFKFTRPSAAAWHYVDWVADLSQNTLPITSVRVDGIAPSNSGGLSTYGGPVTLPGNSLSIMCTPAGTPTTFSAGRVANVNIWGRILTLSERLSMYRNTLQILRNPMLTVGVPSAAASPALAASRWFMCM